MASDDLIEMQGKVVDVCAGGKFKVQTEAGHVIDAHLSGRLHKNKIRVVLGDDVTVGISPYDLTKGRITYRQ